jgi:hypothetical protein
LQATLHLGPFCEKSSQIICVQNCLKKKRRNYAYRFHLDIMISRINDINYTLSSFVFFLFLVSAAESSAHRRIPRLRRKVMRLRHIAVHQSRSGHTRDSGHARLCWWVFFFTPYAHLRSAKEILQEFQICHSSPCNVTKIEGLSR